MKAPAPASKPKPKASLSAPEIHEVIRANRQDIIDCYDKRRETHPEVKGTVRVKFTIANDGTVPRCAVEKTTAHDVPLEDCIVERVKTWRFPPPRGDGIVTVSYPFVFQMKPDAPDAR
ncbi:TonB family protein [Pyxidicoccus sp. 3LFB2]